jgi:hypothetical protein
MTTQIDNTKGRLIIFILLIIFIIIGFFIYINLGYEALCIYIVIFSLLCMLFSMVKLFVEIRNAENNQT